MRCPDVRDLMEPFLDGELDVDRNVAMLKHLELCPPCRCRADAARALHDVVARGACEPLCVEGRRRLLEQAYARCDGVPACRGAGRLRRALVAAVALVALSGVGFAVRHRHCLMGCPTRQLITMAQEVGHFSAPLPPEELAQQLGGDFKPPEIPNLQCKGGSLWPEGGCRGGPVLRYRCNCDGTEIVVFSLDNAHVHFWQTRRLEDGREWVVLEDGDTKILGWLDEPTNRLWCFIGQSAVPHMDERLYVAALSSNMRH